MDKEILDMTFEELRIEVAMLRERCAQLEIRLAYPPWWLLERPKAPNTPVDPWKQPWAPAAPVWTGGAGGPIPNPYTATCRSGENSNGVKTNV